MTKTIVPYTKLHPLVKEVILQSAYKPQFIQMTDDDAYWRMFCDIWEKRTPVLIIEHDIIPWPGAVQEIINCPCHWCSNTYKMRGGFGINHAFGFTKFDEKFMEDLPDVWTQVESTNWKHLDAQLCEIAKREGLTPHPHRPPVTHLKSILDRHEENET